MKRATVNGSEIDYDSIKWGRRSISCVKADGAELRVKLGFVHLPRMSLASGPCVLEVDQEDGPFFEYELREPSEAERQEGVPVGAWVYSPDERLEEFLVRHSAVPLG